MPGSRAPLLTRPFVRLLALQGCFGAALACFALTPKWVVAELGGGAEEVGYITGVFSLANVVLGPVIGIWVDRFGRKPFLLIGAALMAASSLGFLWVDQAGALVYVLRTLQGIAFTSVYIGAATLVTDAAPAARMAQALALLTSTMHGTNAVVPLVVEPASEWYGWGSVFVASALVAGVGLALSFGTREPRSDPSAPIETIPLLDVMRRPVIARTLTVSILVGMASGAMLVFVQPLALERGMQRVAVFVFAQSGTALLARVALGGFIDRTDRYWVCIGAIVLYAVAVFATADLRPGWLIPIGVLSGLAHGVFFPAFNAVTIAGSEAGERGKLMAVYTGAFNGGFLIAAFTLGRLADAWGLAAVFWIPGAGLVAALLFMLAVPGAHRWSAARHPPAP